MCAIMDSPFHWASIACTSYDDIWAQRWHEYIWLKSSRLSSVLCRLNIPSKATPYIDEPCAKNLSLFCLWSSRCVTLFCLKRLSVWYQFKNKTSIRYSQKSLHCPFLHNVSNTRREHEFCLRSSLGETATETLMHRKFLLKNRSDEET